MKVLFYGRLAETIGPGLEIDVRPGSTVAELRDRLVAERPEAKGTLLNRRTRACVGDVLVDDNYIPKPTDQVEFLPPVSGG